MAVLSKDWYGFANAIARIVSIVIRSYIMQVNRNAIDVAVKEAKPLSGTYQFALRQWEQRDRGSHLARPAENARPDGTHWKHEQARIMIIMSDFKAVKMFIPE